MTIIKPRRLEMVHLTSWLLMMTLRPATTYHQTVVKAVASELDMGSLHRRSKLTISVLAHFSRDATDRRRGEFTVYKTAFYIAYVDGIERLWVFTTSVSRARLHVEPR